MYVLSEYFSLSNVIVSSRHVFFVFYNCVYMTGKVLWHFSALSAFHTRTLSPTCSCFKGPIVLTIVYDVQNVAATAARQHYFGLNLRNWIPQSESVITLEAVFFIPVTLHEFVNRQRSLPCCLSTHALWKKKLL